MLKEKIINQYPSLSPKEKKIADYIIKNGRTMFTLSALDIARNTGVSAATVVRFAQHIGYSGFYELRAKMINEVKEELMPEERFELLPSDESKISTCLKVAELEVENINQTINGIEKEKFEMFLEDLRKARCIYTVGIGISSIIARLTAYLFNQAGVSTHFCARDEISFIEKLINLKMKDVILGFSFPPYSRETVKAMRFCYERGVKCLAITDRLTSPIAQWSHSLLLVQTKNWMFTNSISALSMIINVLATELALPKKRKLLHNIDLINKLSKGDFLP